VRIAPVQGMAAGAHAFKTLVDGNAKPDVGTVVLLSQ
jgi:hypothetical protein